MKNTASGFTLIELLIVVAIIGILAAIAVPNFLQAQTKAKLAQAIANMKSVSTAVEMYSLDYNSFPWWATDSNDFLGLKQLTSPISYMSGTSGMRNPFIKNTKIDGNTNLFSNEIDAFIELGTFKQTGSPVFPHEYPTNVYHLESSGPDKGDDYDTHAYPQKGLVYHVSNGLTSRGDLFRGGGAHVADWVTPSQ